MEIRQLKHFVAVAEERSFSRAARRVNIVQSGLSASIKALESELGITLLVRTTRHVELTEAGRTFLAEVRRVETALQGARDAVEAVRGILRGTVQIGTMQRLSPLFDLPSVLARFRAAHPQVEVGLRQAPSGLLLAEVAEGKLDFAFLALPGSAPRGISVTPLGEDPLVLACAAGHALAHRAQVSLAQIADEPFLDFVPQWSVRTMVDRAFAAAHIERHIAFELNDVPTLLDLVENGLGVAVLPRFVAVDARGVRYVPIEPAVGLWRLVLARRERQSLGPAARALLGLIVPRAPGQETGGRRSGPTLKV
jgi:DNA-binding transcriptional LysR family regulator